jgi:hypothetical protein
MITPAPTQEDRRDLEVDKPAGRPSLQAVPTLRSRPRSVKPPPIRCAAACNRTGGAIA